MPASPVLTVAPADPVDAAAFFATRLACQTDVSDVAAALASGSPGFALIDSRSDAATDLVRSRSQRIKAISRSEYKRWPPSVR